MVKSFNSNSQTLHMPLNNYSTDRSSLDKSNQELAKDSVGAKTKEPIKTEKNNKSIHETLINAVNTDSLTLSRSTISKQGKNPNRSQWQDELSHSISDIHTLLDYLQIDKKIIQTPTNESMDFPIRVPYFFANLMEKNNPKDPLFLQVIPQAKELLRTPGYTRDPLEENNKTPKPGLIHKYTSRALMIVSTTCAINCRYCFRRHFPYQDNNPGKKRWQESFTYLQENKSINEIILSGGDPLATANNHLKWLSSEIQKIPHIKRLRIHTRLPVVLPSRIDEEFINLIDNIPLQKVIVLHINHPKEVSPELIDAVKKLKERSITFFNQSVLLKGINDNKIILANLSELLFSIGIQPYYLHQLDPVEGSAHFKVSKQEAVKIYQQLRASLPGYLVPLLVEEKPNTDAKTPIFFSAE